MTLFPSITREISHLSSASTPAGRAVIRSIENLTARPRLIHMACGCDREVAVGREFCEVIVGRYGLRLDIVGGALASAGGAGAMMDYLRRATYRLAPEPIAALGYGFDCEEAR